MNKERNITTERVTTYTSAKMKDSTIVQSISNTKTTFSTGLGMKALSFVFYIAFLVLFTVAFYRYTIGMPLPTFTGLLDMIENVPQVTLEPNFIGTITADWGLFNFFRDFLNLFIGTLGTVLFATTMIIQVIILIMYFIGWAFGIV